MSVEQAKRLLADAGNEPDRDMAFTYLVSALEEIIAELETHQHSYTAPRSANLNGTWATTSPRRDTQSAARAVYAQQMKDKL